MTNDRMQVPTSLVRKLIEEQFPQWAGLPIKPVSTSGWDNHTFHLGECMSVRLPSAERYVAQVEKEHRWLPWLKVRLPFTIAEPIAMGEPGAAYPWPWSIYRWLPGEAASKDNVPKKSKFAYELASFINHLLEIDATTGPLVGEHNFYRGGPLSTYEYETIKALDVLGDDVPQREAHRCWKEAMRSHWTEAPVWIHGDLSPSNILVQEASLSAVIDFGGCGVGDPACDLAIAWTFFSGESRDILLHETCLDAATQARGRGWALWKALIVLVENIKKNPLVANRARSVVKACCQGF